VNRFSGKTAHLGLSVSLHNVIAMFPELKEQISSLYKNFKFYFSNYIGSTGINRFGIKFYLPKPYGIDKYNSLLPNAVGASFAKDPSGKILDELKGHFLDFTISDSTDLEIMVINIIYYMLKYKCLAAVNEGKAVESDLDPDTKYALIASPSGLYTADYLLLSYKNRPFNSIRNSGLSEKAQELYANLFSVDFGTIYQGMQLNDYTRIFKYGTGYSPYLMSNPSVFKEMFDIIFGRGMVKDLFGQEEYDKLN
jgi:hypothetical protein